MALDREILEEFEQKTKFSIIQFFSNISLFIERDMINITEYYSGNLKEYNTTSFNNLSILLNTTQSFFETISGSKDRLTNYKWFDLIEQVEQVENTLSSIKNSAKWLRSSIGINDFNSNPELEIALKQFQTLESVSRNTLADQDFDNNWYDIAIKNDLEEEDYTSDGGVNLKVNFNSQSKTFNIATIVDNIQGEKILGLDLDKKITFLDNDLKTLNHRDTFLQTINILTSLKKRDNPEFPDEGINEKIAIGSNIASLAFPILLRQLSELFRTDDTIKSFVVNDIKRQQDAIYLSFNVESRLGETTNFSTLI